MSDDLSPRMVAAYDRAVQQVEQERGTPTTESELDQFHAAVFAAMAADEQDAFWRFAMDRRRRRDAVKVSGKSRASVKVIAAEYGHDGRCDHDGGCDMPITVCMLSAVAPECWSDTARSASVAFLCDEHVAAEPVADLQDAEYNASCVEGPLRKIWELLLSCYPEPVKL